MTAGTEGDGLAAALIQISGHAERIGGLDARETAHHQETTARLREAAPEAASVGTPPPPETPPRAAETPRRGRFRPYPHRRHRRHHRPPRRDRGRTGRARQPG